MLPRKEIYNDGELYLTRYYLFKLFGYDYVLHKFSRPDTDERLHTHPWRRAYSFVLKGSYREQRLIGLDAKRGAIVGTRRVRWYQKITSRDAHRIVGLYSKRYGDGALCKDANGTGRGIKRHHKTDFNVWTLFLMGKYVQKWGFLDKVYTGLRRPRPENHIRPYIRGAIQLHPYDEAPRGNTTVKHYGNCRLWKDGEATHRDRPMRIVK